MSDNIYVLGLYKAIGRYYKDFNKERRDSKMSFTKAISLATKVFNHKKHNSEKEDGWVISTEKMKLAGVDPRTFYRMLEKYPLYTLESSNWSYEQGIAKRWQPTDAMGMVMDYYNQEKSPDIFLLEMDGKPRMQIVDEVGSSLKPEDYDYFCYAHIDKEALIDYLRDEVKKPDVTVSERVGMQRMIGLLRKCNGTLEQGYLRCKSGRLVSRGIGSVQNLRKEARQKAFKGYYDIDFVNCHYTLLNHLYHDSYIEEYVDNTERVRNRIAEDVDIEISSVKKMLLAILYGCSLSLNGEGAIVEEVGKHKGAEFLNHFYVKGIVSAVQDAVDHLTDEGFLWEIINEHKIPPKKALAYLLQMIEGEILEYCISLYTPEALFYDGFVTQEDVDTEDLSAKILEDLHYDIKITKELL